MITDSTYDAFGWLRRDISSLRSSMIPIVEAMMIAKVIERNRA
jgi:hypothetical protein